MIEDDVAQIFNEENRKLDLYFSLLVLSVFMLSFFFLGPYLSKKSQWQRYEVYVLKNQNGICDFCWKDQYIKDVKTFFVGTNPEANISILFPVWLDKKARLFSLSILSSREIGILEMYKKISEFEKCESKLMEVRIDDYRMENWSRANRSGKKCKLFFMYERKL